MQEGEDEFDDLFLEEGEEEERLKPVSLSCRVQGFKFRYGLVQLSQMGW